MHQRQLLLSYFSQKFWRTKPWAIYLVALWLLSASPVLAHHAMDGRTPVTFWEGFLTGLAHPLIGPDHFAFIVAVGLLASIKPQGILLPVALVLSAMLGTGFHIYGFNLPGAELLIAGSILLFGILLALKNTPNMLLILLLAVVAGLFHGYAYGEAITGAETTPLLAYLTGFTLIQGLVAASAFAISKVLLQRKEAQKVSTSLRSLGLVICGVGLAFVTSRLIEAILPVGT